MKLSTQIACSAPNSGDMEQQSSPAETQSLTAADRKSVLRERAWELAHRQEDDSPVEECIQAIEFMLGDERYAMDVRFISEVYPVKDIASIPCTPSFVLGVVSVRGEVLSIVDVREFFSLPKKEITGASKILVLSNGKMKLGILADSVVGQSRVPIHEIQDHMPGTGGTRVEYVRGVTKERLVVVEAEKFLTDETVVVHQEVGDQQRTREG